MSLHYKKDGSLDMRYSSSKEAVNQSYGGTGSSSFGQSGSSYSSSSGFSSYGGMSSGGSPSYGTAASSDLHYKKDGAPDMRYSSSKLAAEVTQSSAIYPSPSRGSTYPSPQSNPLQSKDLHYKKDGSLDMRYTTSKEAAATALASGIKVMNLSNPDVHLKKDGTCDMRLRSSKQSQEVSYDIPSYVPLKGNGTPDMRKTKAKEWVAQQAKHYDGKHNLPNWVPTKKDGSIDTTKAIGRCFAKKQQASPVNAQLSVTEQRNEYWKDRLLDELFQGMLRAERLEPHPLPPPATIIQPTNCLKQGSSSINASSGPASNSTNSAINIPENVQKIDYVSLVFEDESTGNLGKGAFGVVNKATWNGNKVAVKKLHITQLTRKDKSEFETEIRVLAALGKHQNLVYLHGYCTDPPCIVMELVELGSLNNLLYYCNEPRVEAKMTDGRVKLKLVLGTAEGMYQLHEAKVVHGDLKPQNVLVTKDYVAKVTDFGLATLRGKTSCSIRSHDIDDDDEYDDDDVLAHGRAVGGTSGYMAPELLDSTSPPDFPSDVFSFGILLNEVVCEQEPYSDQYANFAGRGPFGAANYAKLGKRPTTNKTMTPPPVEDLIVLCWSQDPAKRPTFLKILSAIRDPMFKIPNSVDQTIP